MGLDLVIYGFFIFIFISLIIIVKSIYELCLLFEIKIELSRTQKIITFCMNILFSYFYFPSIYTLSLTSTTVLEFDGNTYPIDLMAHLWWFAFLGLIVFLCTKKSRVMLAIIRNIWLTILFIFPLLFIISLSSIKDLNMLSPFWLWWSKYLLLASQQDIVDTLFYVKLDTRAGIVLILYQIAVFIIFIITRKIFIHK